MARPEKDLNSKPGALVYATPRALPGGTRGQISDWYRRDEDVCVEALLSAYQPSDTMRRRIEARAAKLVEAVRKQRTSEGGLDAFLAQYDLSSQEGVVLMCLAEALLRVPDADTADRLIADKIRSGHWKEHLGTSESAFVNAGTWSLMLTGRMVAPTEDALSSPDSFMSRLVTRAGEPVIRNAMRQAMKIMGHQFVMGRNIEKALKRSRDKDNSRYRYSFDMLGEAALTAGDAGDYFDAYARAIAALGKAVRAGEGIAAAPGISVKLSALYPRYEVSHRERALGVLVPRLTELALQAKGVGIGFCMDAEEADRLELSLDIFESVFRTPQLEGYNGLGLAVQAYQKRAPAVLDFLIELAQDVGRQIPVRLVKGAYWDTEIKLAQEEGLEDYPVFTRKIATDVSYLACAQKLLAVREHIYPQFATHNAHTVCSVLALAGTRDGFEFQRLHGMGEELYGELLAEDDGPPLACRVYAPVGEHEDLLPYLVRRLLENGANTSFVNRIVDESLPVAEIVADPAAALAGKQPRRHPLIPLPAQIFGDQRRNSRGHCLHDETVLAELAESMQQALQKSASAPVLSSAAHGGEASEPVTDPADHRRTVGFSASAGSDVIRGAHERAVAAWPAWNQLGGRQRATILERAADLFEANAPRLLALCIREAGKTLEDAEPELREAVDFLRYYAQQARQDFEGGELLPGPTGEENRLYLEGRGVFVCISPWNFPLAIFTGQIAAALAAGNTVLAKPAEQTPLVAACATRLLLEAGIPADVLHLLPGDGAAVGAALVGLPDIAGVAFTGSTATAKTIHRSLAAKDGQIAALIAETGGLNAMLVDSSALPEQVVKDTVKSAFNSAGQRCSALRVLFLQEHIAPRVIELLKGAMDELEIGDPGLISTDVGPVIDADAQALLDTHIARHRERIVHQCELPTSCATGTYCPPVAIRLDSLADLPDEVFGPILHIVTYPAGKIDSVIDQVNASGYGLTLGIHTRIDSRANYVQRRVRVGNVYVNRNMVGAVVGVQPFGGRGLSGTGPKAGGPRYLHRFATEKTVSVNTAAVGGNTSLMSLNTERAAGRDGDAPG